MPYHICATTCDVKLGNRDGSEGPPGNAVVKGRSKSIPGGVVAVAGLGLRVLSLSLSLLVVAEDGEDGNLGGSGTEGPASVRPLFRGGIYSMMLLTSTSTG